MKKTLIGHTGFIGSYLKKNISFNYLYDSSNLHQIRSIADHGIIYCAAPTSSRLRVENDPDGDRQSVKNLIDILSKVQADRIVLFGTVDSHLPLKKPYGHNRLMLENFVKQRFQKHHVMIISSLIHYTIQKNVLYDLKYGKWLSSINAMDQLQWYPMENLIPDIEYCVNQNVRELYLVSEPISNLELVQTFTPSYLPMISYKQSHNLYDFKPYRFTKEEIFRRVTEYLQ
jgi:hypothetical protein